MSSTDLSASVGTSALVADHKITSTILSARSSVLAVRNGERTHCDSYDFSFVKSCGALPENKEHSRFTLCR